MSQTMSGPLVLTADLPSVTMLPGYRDRVVITAENRGGSVLVVEMEAQGLPAGWLDLQPPLIILSPGQSALATLTLSPPAEAPLGTYPLAVWGREREDAAINARADLILVLGEPEAPMVEEPPAVAAPVATMPEEPPPLPAWATEAAQPVGDVLDLELTPPSQTTAGVAHYALLIRNRGSTPLDVEIQPHDPGGPCTVEARPPRLSLSPRGEGSVRLAVRPVAALGPGEVRRVSRFTVAAHARGLAQPALVEGSLEQVRRPWWQSPLAWVAMVAGALVLLLLVVLAVSFWPRRPTQQTAVPATLAPTAVPPTAQPTSAPTAQPTEAPTPAGTPTLSRAEIEAAVCEAVERFQSAKEHAQRTNDTSQLDQILRKQALEKQTELVLQYKAEGCYWEIRLLAPITCQFLDVQGDSYVRVKAHKIEERRKYCSGELVPGQSVDRDEYDAEYVVERMDGQWYVTWRE